MFGPDDGKPGRMYRHKLWNIFAKNLEHQIDHIYGYWMRDEPSDNDAVKTAALCLIAISQIEIATKITSIEEILTDLKEEGKQ
ncbi:MAG TPA: hypothetical protein DEP37_15465 [Algoriphagus sp.]|nr:hypothetical protein [Algoriphagus sp.]|tara:strand:+ start:505 stop:753 length:249 start_codon:yes stop_codon:yes gene_type:complete